MKKPTTTRKHGYQARAQIIARRLCLTTETEVRETPALKQRLKTSLSYEQSCQSYLWTTDRGRSRLIKH
jgi:hypothetical protein